METPRKFLIAKLSIRKLGSSSVLMIMLLPDRKPCDDKLKGKWQEKFLLSHLKDTLKIIYRNILQKFYIGFTSGDNTYHMCDYWRRLIIVS